MSINAEPDYDKKFIDMTKSLLTRLIDDGLENDKSSVEYFRPLIEECVKYSNNKDVHKIDNQHFSNVIFLVNETDNGLEYFKNLDLSDIGIDVYKQLLSFFGEWKTRFEKKMEYEQEQKDKYIRLQAEFDNYKKRVHKEKTLLESQYKYKALSGLIDIIYDLELAKKNEPDNEGIQIIFSKLESYLTSHGVEEVDCNGEFDADKHECLTIVNTGKENHNQIVEVVKKGYSIGGTIVRYPKVVVSK